MRKTKIRMRCYFYHFAKAKHFGTLWFVKNFDEKERLNTAWSKCWSECGKWQKQVFVLKKTKNGIVAFVREFS